MLDEFVDLGLRFLSIDDPAAVVSRIDDPDAETNAHNRRVLEEHFDLRDLPNRLSDAFATVGWDQW